MFRSTLHLASLLLICLSSPLPADAAERTNTPAFPGASGPGATSPGGRGGRVLEVTNLADHGPGSFRAAVEAAGPRIVVFRVGGAIVLASPVSIRHPFLTVAGQSAPGGNVCIHGSNTRIEATDVVFRHVAFHGSAIERAGHSQDEDGVVFDQCAFLDDMGPCADRSLPALVDNDHDGMPDAWERRHALNWGNPADGVGDADRDGYTNVEEFLNGTLPRKDGDSIAPAQHVKDGAATVLDPDAFKRHIDFFNAMEDETVVNLVPNADAWAWMRDRVPLFEADDAGVEEIYWFRWWALRKHLRSDPATGGHTFTEFINKERTISSALGHNLMEGRWLRDQSYFDDWVNYWLRGNDGKPQEHLHKYSQWLADALLQRYLVTDDQSSLIDLLDDLVADYRQWETEQRRADGLFWQYDVRDAMEESISGSRREKHVRPTINSYMFANARAIAAIARLAGRGDLARDFDADAARIQKLTLESLWNAESEFFEVRRESGPLAGVREAIGFIPWYFGLPPAGRGYEKAWAQLTDPEGFRAPFGITTAERRHPEFRSHGIGTCEWDGALWPYATSQTLNALARVLREYPQDVVTRQDYFDAFVTYARSQYYDGLPYIGEYQDEVSGMWLKGRDPRSRWYNHSTFADLVITGIAGLRPRADDVIEVDPLMPDDEWSWFCLDRVRYRGHEVTILWDRDGSRYGRGAGLRVLVDGNEVAHAPKLQKLTATLPEKR